MENEQNSDRTRYEHIVTWNHDNIEQSLSDMLEAYEALIEERDAAREKTAIWDRSRRRL